MSSSELLTDAYLIELLQRDAQRKPTRRSDAPKPNTRFLRNIVRDVDSHNSALKAREEADARARQRRLRREGQPSKNREEDEQERRKRRRRRDDDEGDEGGKARSERHREKRKKSRSRSPRRHRRDEGRRDRERAQSGKQRSRSRSRSPRRSAHRHHESRSERLQRESSPPKRHIKQRTRSRSASSTSDPVEELLGPQPLPPNQTLPRGRGAFKPQSSSIETRFREGYDPKKDTRDDEEDGVEDDWDRGLEAVRDRAKWKENGAERLRAAGFTEKEVQNWESGPAGSGEEAAREKDIRDVRWMKKGEGVREWDRGKGEDGKADWIGRLKS